MIGLIPPDRWTCPSCGQTEVPDVPEEEIPAAIRKAQVLHAKDHPAPSVEPSRARHPLRRRTDRSRA